MTWMVFAELLPEARATVSPRIVGIAVAASIGAMLVLEAPLVL
jgi:Mg2+/Co2+ transporter CorB